MRSNIVSQQSGTNPPAYQGTSSQTVSGSNSYTFQMTVTGNFPSNTPTFSGSVTDSSGSTNYLTNVVADGTPTQSSVPVKVTVTTNPPGGGNFSTTLSITIVLTYTQF